jgi:nitroreductase
MCLSLPSANTRIPEIERTLAVGAAVQNLCLALHAEGFGTIWRTGPATYDPAVVDALGFPPASRLIGFIYAGTPTQPMRAAARPSPEAYVGELR